MTTTESAASKGNRKFLDQAIEAFEKLIESEADVAMVLESSVDAEGSRRLNLSINGAPVPSVVDAGAGLGSQRSSEGDGRLWMSAARGADAVPLIKWASGGRDGTD